MLSHRISVLEIHLNESLIDYGDFRSLVAVRRGELAPAKQGHAERGKVARTDGVYVGSAISFLPLTTWQLDATEPVRTGEQRRVG